MSIRNVCRLLACAAIAIVLAGCFVSHGLFERERLWDPAWFGRYEAEGVMFVVLPDDPAQRTYLIGEFEQGATKVDTYRVALYPGWGDTRILGQIKLSGGAKDEELAAYTFLRSLGGNRVLSIWPDCKAEFAQAHGLKRDHDTCVFDSLEALRSALKAYLDESPPDASGDQPKPLEHRRDHPLSTIGVMGEAGIFNDSEGVHGGLKLTDVSPSSPAAKAGLKKGDLIFGIGDPRPAIGEELLLRIAAAVPGTSVAITFFEGKTHAKRTVNVVAAPLQ